MIDVDVSQLSLAEQRVLRRDRAALEEFRVLGLDCLEHAPVREVRFQSMAVRLQARRLFGHEFRRACRREHPQLSTTVDSPRRLTLDDLLDVEWAMRERAAAQTWRGCSDPVRRPRLGGDQARGRMGGHLRLVIGA